MKGRDDTLNLSWGAVTLAALAIVVLTGFGILRAGLGSLAVSAFDLIPVKGGLLLGLVCGAPPRLSGTSAGFAPWCSAAGVLGSGLAWALALLVLPRRLGSPWLAKLRLVATAVALSTLAPWIAAAFVAPGLGHPVAAPAGVAEWVMALLAAGLGATMLLLIAFRRVDVLEDIERPLPTILGSRFLHATLCASILLFFAAAAVIHRVPPPPPAAARQLGAQGLAPDEARLEPSRPDEEPSEQPPL